jgi:hypothetical protein
VATLIRHWFPLRFAGVLAGLPRGRAEAWLRRGRAGDPAYAQFSRAVAEALAEVRQVERMLEQALAELRGRARAGDPAVASVLAGYMGVGPRPFGFVRDAVHRLHARVGRQTKRSSRHERK